MTHSFLQTPLYLITDRGLCQGKPFLQVLQDALTGGVKFIQLREKDLPTREFLSLAAQVKTLCSQKKATLLINDRIDICLAVKAEGVHLRADSLPVHVVRKILGKDKLIGISVHSVEEAFRAEKEGANFVTLGPIYETPSKIPYGPPLGLSILRAARKRIGIPLFALGGIRSERIEELLQSGADGIALISAIIAAKNPTETTQSLIFQLKRFAKK